MEPVNIFRECKQNLDKVAPVIFGVNRLAAKLNGTRVTIPKGVGAPLSYFVGCVVQLANCRHAGGGIVAAIRLPYKPGEAKPGVSRTPGAGMIIETGISEKWFT